MRPKARPLVALTILFPGIFLDKIQGRAKVVERLKGRKVAKARTSKDERRTSNFQRRTFNEGQKIRDTATPVK